MIKVIRGIEKLKLNTEYQIDDNEDNTIVATLNHVNRYGTFYLLFRSNTGVTYKFLEKDIIKFQENILYVTLL